MLPKMKQKEVHGNIHDINYQNKKSVEIFKD